MSSPVPPIYSPRPHIARLSIVARFASVAVGLASLAVFAAAIYIHPDPRGVGSHHQLGLYPCNLFQRTGVPCPTCGMTTSFAWFAHGHLLASLYVQPMGFVVASLVAMTFWTAFYIALTGRPAHRLLRSLPARYYLVPLFALALLAWMWKITIHAIGHDGWG